MTSACTQLVEGASAGAGAALRAVDCMAGETVASAFARLFGGGGSAGLMPALTIALTLYIAFFAFSLLTGRSRLGISALTPRILTLGLVLTFATSWVAYSQVVWNLTIGAPDEIAGVLTGAKGSATQIFADRMDLVFAAIADAAGQGQPAQAAASQGAAGAAQGAASGAFTSGNLMWIAALMLLLGTVGVLVTARLALAVLLALGPVFVVMALFEPTRGLTGGWLKGLVMTAVTPLFVVVGGGIVMEMLVPVVSMLANPEAGGRATLALFVLAAVHCALMAMVMKVAGTMVADWRAFGLSGGSAQNGRDGASAVPATVNVAPASQVAPLTPAHAGGAAAAMRAMAMPVTVEAGQGGSSSSTSGGNSRTTITQVPAMGESGLPPLPRARARGIGSRFAAPRAAVPAGQKGMIR